MPYRLTLDDLPGSFKHLVRRETKRLTKLTPASTSAPSADPAADVHDRRKGLKRLRALMLLAVTHDDDRALRNLERQLRDLGRQLGQRRDADVVLTTLDRLAADGLIPSKALLATLRATLATSAAPARVAAETTELFPADILGELSTLDFAAVTTTTLIGAAQRTYTRARRARRLAEREATSDAFHDWRKQVQRHARHLQLLADLWPAEMAMRLDAARQLSVCLGTEHDLHTLDGRLVATSVSKAHRKAFDRLRATIAGQQVALRQAALDLADRLFAERGRAYRARLSAYDSRSAVPVAAQTKNDAAKTPRLVPARRLGYERLQGDGSA